MARACWAILHRCSLLLHGIAHAFPREFHARTQRWQSKAALRLLEHDIAEDATA